MSSNKPPEKKVNELSRFVCTGHRSLLAPWRAGEQRALQSKTELLDVDVSSQNLQILLTKP